LAAGDSTTCFNQINPKTKRWGWVVDVNTFPATLPLYVGVGGCDRTKAKEGGTVTIAHNVSTGKVTVSFNLDPAFFFTATHVYYGTTAKIPLSFSPGQYGSTITYDKATQVSGVHTFTYNAAYVFIVHASACGDSL
jgi:hypothetical protein